MKYNSITVSNNFGTSFTKTNLIHRWVRFEEDVEENGKRWSKPHVPALPLSSFVEFRKYFANGIVALDVTGNSLADLVGKIENGLLI